MKKHPLISINIPTWNSEKTIELTLDSIKNQTYKNYEIIIVDKDSKDKTRQIAKKYTNKIYIDKRKLLGARNTGVGKSKGDYVLLLDSDQILEKHTLEKAVKLIKNYDMIILGEESYKPKTTIEKLISIDRKTVDKKKIIKPEKSVLLPRIFKKTLIKKAFRNIPSFLFDVVTLQDHAIIYYECYKISNKIGYLKNAVFHKEPSTIYDLFIHYYNWGWRVATTSEKMPLEYRKMFGKKIKNRTHSVSFWNINFFLVFPILLIKAVGYYLGIISFKIKSF